MAESFHWSDKFLTGLPEIDAQHHELVALINAFGDALSGEVSDRKPEHWFAELAAYARHHFAAEEALIERTGLDRRHLGRQREQHRNFISTLAKLRSLEGEHDDAEHQRMMRFLVRWLTGHILGTDQMMGRQVIAVRAGMTPEAAFELTEAEAEADFGARGAEPLVDALNELYTLISARNRELLELNRALETRVAERTAELREANQRLEALAMTDALTGLPNRRNAMSALEHLWGLLAEQGKPLACLLIDADGFKAVNDTWGHEAGDVVLRSLSHCLRDHARTDDLVCRLGGDEFLVLCPQTTLQGAITLGEQLRRRVNQMDVRVGDARWKGSISVGAAERSASMEAPEALVQAADRGVYLAKSRGRNTVASCQFGG